MKNQTTARLIKFTGLFTGAVGVLGVLGYGITGTKISQANDSGQDKTSAQSTSKSNATASTTAPVPYTPSKHPGVEVANVPAAPSSGANTVGGYGTGSIYVTPGSPKPRFAPRIQTRGGGIRYEAGKTRAGGIAAHVGPDFYPYAKATVNSKGKVQLDCLEGGDHSRHQHLHTKTHKSASKSRLGQTKKKHVSGQKH